MLECKKELSNALTGATNVYYCKRTGKFYPMRSVFDDGVFEVIIRTRTRQGNITQEVILKRNGANNGQPE